MDFCGDEYHDDEHDARGVGGPRDGFYVAAPVLSDAEHDAILDDLLSVEHDRVMGEYR